MEEQLKIIRQHLAHLDSFDAFSEALKFIYFSVEINFSLITFSVILPWQTIINPEVTALWPH